MGLWARGCNRAAQWEKKRTPGGVRSCFKKIAVRYGFFAGADLAGLEAAFGAGPAALFSRVTTSDVKS